MMELPDQCMRQAGTCGEHADKCMLGNVCEIECEIVVYSA